MNDAIFEQILEARGLDSEQKRSAFLNPKYEDRHDPFLLPDMQEAVDRLKVAQASQEKITIYGDYDIDGLTATTILSDAFASFGFTSVDNFIPNRFVEGYGLTVDAVERIAATGTKLIVTVDCGSLSHVPISRAKELGLDVIVTDHHNVAAEQPPAIAVVNPKRFLAEHPDAYKTYQLLPTSAGNSAKLYPFVDLAGCGVAFKLVQALQTVLPGLEDGQEKWLLDLVALGTVCDIVTLVDENRANVYWGLKVLSKTRRPGLKALMAVARVDPKQLTTRSLGFALGPRMNAAGRLETAQIALDILTAKDNETAFEKASELDALNLERRTAQDQIFKSAIEQAEQHLADNVLVVSHAEWNHGIVGIVAAKLLEKYHKPTYVLQEMGDEAKGSARSFGRFSAADAIRASDDLIIKGGGHMLAAGVTLPTKNIQAFRERVNHYYNMQNLIHDEEEKLLLPKADVLSYIEDISEELVSKIATLEPFGSGNPQPIICSKNLRVIQVKRMGTEGQHLKLELLGNTKRMHFLAFNAPQHFFVDVGEQVSIWYQPDINEWQGRRTVEGMLLHLSRQ